MQPKVTIICLAYNQEKFIKQALDGFVMQKTKFPFQVIVHDDASTDKTADIIRAYAKKYSDIIKPIFQENNLFSSGKARSIFADFIAPKIKSEYVAICEGDDYWTDPNKLQKQADFLDRHPDYTICFHRVKVFWEKGECADTIIPGRTKNLSFYRLLYTNFIPNCSVMYRWNFDKNLWLSDIYPGDWYLHLMHAKHGRIGFLRNVMAHYRRHCGGISFVSVLSEEKFHLQYGVYEMNFFLAVEKNIAPNAKEYHSFVCEKLRELCYIYVKHGFLDKAEKILKLCPDAFDQQKVESNEKYKKYQYGFNRLLVVAIVLLIIAVLGIIF